MKNISILVDNDSWILPYCQQLNDAFLAKGLNSELFRKADDISSGDVCFLLGCTSIVSHEILTRNSINLVVHESALPHGKGFAPMIWQILEGLNEIPVRLIEAGDKVDSGAIWIEDTIKLNGTELSSEWRNLQGLKTIELCRRFIEEYDTLKPVAQSGKESFYPRRSKKDSVLNIDKSLREQFELLRVVDNNYPAFFSIRGKRYILKIEKADEE